MNDPHVVSLDDIGGYWGEVDEHFKEVYSTRPVSIAEAKPLAQPSIAAGAPTNILDLARSRLADVHKRLAEFHGLESEAAMLERMIAAADVKDYQ